MRLSLENTEAGMRLEILRCHSVIALGLAGCIVDSPLEQHLHKMQVSKTFDFILN